MKTPRFLLIVSATLNLIFVLTGSFVFVKVDGFSIVKNKVNSIFSSESTTEKFNPYYYDRTSLFQRLGIDDDDIVMLGDSLIDGNEWAEVFQNENIKNRGINADRTTGVLDRLKDITSGKPTKIFLMIGVNDLDFGANPEVVLENYKKIIEKINSETPETKIYIHSLLPVNEEIKMIMPNVDNEKIYKVNSLLKEFAEKNKIKYIDLFSLVKKDNQLNSDLTNDGIHLNSKGYSIWQNAIKEYLQ